MLKKTTFILFFFTLFLGSLNAQSDLSYGIEPERDSVAFARFRKHMDSIRTERPTVALVLSGGGAKGAAHISVIRYLEKQGIPIDLVMGTSIGGLVGGLYACGYTGEELQAIIRDQDWNYLLRDTYPRRFDALQQKDYNRQFQLTIPFGTYKWDFHKPVISRRSILHDGIVQGRNVEDLLASLLVGYSDEIDFLSLPIPFVCVATDMISAKPKVWHSGSLIDALRSTMSIPGLFSPVKKNGMVLTDGSMRNNFPAAIAKQMGADIIIGVDISAPGLNANQMNSLIDIVFQTTDVLGREAYNAALNVTDIYIQPQVNDFSLLSFDKESIDTIIERGRIAVEKQADKIEALKEKMNGIQVRNSHRHNTTKAVNLHKTAIQVDKIQFSGINAKEEKYLRRKMHLMQNIKHSIHIMELEDMVSYLIGLNAFEKVTYKILDDKPPYTVQFNCFRSPINQLGASVRFDAIDYAAVLLHYGINFHQLTGSRLDLTARLGQNSILTASHTLSTGQGIDFGTKVSFQAVRYASLRFGESKFSLDYNLGHAETYLSLSPWRKMNINAGICGDYTYLISLLGDNINSLSIYEYDKENIYVGAFLSLRSDSFDDPYFPTHGTRYMIKYNIYDNVINDATSLHTLQLGLRSAFSKGRLTIMPFIDGKYVSANIAPYANMLSVSDANRFFDQQITFIGISTPTLMMRTLGSAGLSARVLIGKSHYLTASFQAIQQSEEPKDFLKGSTIIGAALEYAYKTIVGPLRFNVHWSDMTKRPGLYLGIGLDF
ncbi:MAG: patatin-like phospholipase family protein [Bacteroidales bacterium]|nr:patatin-like phospholipase family protein [Bacteroidales bacterium]